MKANTMKKKPLRRRVIKVDMRLVFLYDSSIFFLFQANVIMYVVVSGT